MAKVKIPLTWINVNLIIQQPQFAPCSAVMVVWNAQTRNVAGPKACLWVEGSEVPPEARLSTGRELMFDLGWYPSS